MKGWRDVTLSDISMAIDYGYTASSSYINIGPKFLRITDIARSNIIDWNSVPFCSISQEDNEKYKLYSGDIVIARTGASTGATYTIKDTDPKDLVFASYLIRYRINPEIADANLVGKFLRSKNWNEYVSGVVGGSAQPGANAKVLGAYSFLLPPLTEQRAIAAVLSSLDDKIDLLHRQNATLEAIAETLFRQWFVVEAKEEWEETTIEEAIIFYDNQRIPLSQTERDKKKTGELYPYYGAAQIMDYINEYIFDGDYLLIAEDGTVRNELGFPILQRTNGKFWVNNHTHIIQAKQPYTNDFIYIYLLKKNIDEIITGAVQPKISQGNLKKLQFFKYPHSLVLEYNNRTKPYFEKICSNRIQINTIEKLRDTLLPKLMSGEVRVDC